MNKTLGLLAIGALGLSLIGCNKGDSKTAVAAEPAVPPMDTSPGYEKKLLPMKVGNEWVYTLESIRIRGGRRAEATTDVTYKIVKVSGSTCTIEVTNKEKKVVDRQVWQVNDKGLYQISISTANVAYNPPQPVAVFPIQSNKTFNWKGTGVMPTGERGTQSTEVTVREPMEVDTPAGRFNAIPFESRFTLTGGAVGSGDSVTFMTPGVGIVRFRQTVKTDLETGSLTLKLKEKNF